MIHQDTKRFLLSTFGVAQPSFEWSKEHNDTFFKGLKERYSDEEIKKNSSEIKEVIRDFLHNIGKPVILFKAFDFFVVKLLPYTVEPQNSIHLEALLSIVTDDMDKIIYPYKEHSDQLALSGSMRRRFNAILHDSSENVNPKQLIRYVIKHALKLSTKDLILIKKRDIIVKLFERHPIFNDGSYKEIEQDKAIERYAGFKPEDLENTYKELFKEGEIKVFLEDVLSELFILKLNFHTMTQSYFETYALKLIQKSISDALNKHIDNNDEYIYGLAGYIFRNNFYEAFSILAKQMLIKLSEKDEHVIEFLKTFNGSVAVINGKKYIIPSIIDSDGNRWNPITMQSIVSLWFENNALFQELKVVIKMKRVQSAELPQEILELEDEFQELLTIKEKLTNKIDNNYATSSQRIGEKLSFDDVRKISAKLEKVKELLREVSAEKTAAIKENNKFMAEITDIKKKLNNVQRVLKQSSPTFKNIHLALRDALIRRKELIHNV